jgi:hypothetical protein
LAEPRLDNSPRLRALLNKESAGRTLPEKIFWGDAHSETRGYPQTLQIKRDSLHNLETIMNNEQEKPTLKESDLSQFYGTTQYYKVPVPWQPFLYTDGVQYVVQAGEAYWILDLIGSWQAKSVIKNDKMLQNIQFWTLNVREDRSAEMICERDSDDVVVRQEISYTSFPLTKIRFYLNRMGFYWAFEGKGPRTNSDYGVLILPSES